MSLISKDPFFFSCKESRIESPTSLYGCFSLGLFEMSQSLTIANALRRTLLSNIYGIAITFVKIEGVFHEYSSLPGIKESVLDILMNLKQIVLTHEKMLNVQKNFEKLEHQKYENINQVLSLKKDLENNSNFLLKKPLHGFLQVRGPGIVRARDLKLPFCIQCVDPMQYIATLSDDGLLNMKFEIGSFFTQKNDKLFLNKKENHSNEFDMSNYFSTLTKKTEGVKPLFMLKKDFYIKNNQFTKKFKSLSLDAIFFPISKVNYVLEFSKQSEQQIFDHRIILEVWTNGSIHPRQAVLQAIKNLIQVYIRLEKANILFF